MRRQLQIKIYPDGKIEAKTLGIAGRECTGYISVLEALLHARTVESAYTQEYEQTQVQEEAEPLVLTRRVEGEGQP